MTTETFVASLDEYVEFASDPDYITVAGLADYSTLLGPDGDATQLATVTSVGFIGADEEYVSVTVDGEVTVTASGPIDVVELDADQLDVITLAELTQITKNFFGNGIQFQHAASAVTAEEGIIYLCDTTAGSFAVTPFEPQSDGDWFGVWDVGGAFADNNLTVPRGTMTVQEAASDLRMNCSNTGVVLIAEGTNWNVFALSRFGAEEFVSAGGSTVEQNVFIQEAQPTADPPYVWWELDNAGNLSDLKVVLP